MFPSLGMLLYIAFVVGGIYWCAEIFGRLGRDVAQLKTTDDAFTRFMIILMWGITALIIFVTGSSLWRLFSGAWRQLAR